MDPRLYKKFKAYKAWEKGGFKKGEEVSVFI